MNFNSIYELLVFVSGRFLNGLRIDPYVQKHGTETEKNKNSKTNENNIRTLCM